MLSNQDLHLSPITGKLIRLAQAATTVHAPKANPKHESQSKSKHQSTQVMPPPPPYSSSAPPVQVTKTIIQQFKNCTINLSDGNSSWTSHHSSSHRPSAPERTKSRSHAPSQHASKSTSRSTASIPRTANGAIEAHNKSRRSPSSKEKGVRFTESVSVREKEPKHWDPAGEHRTNSRSKSGRRPEARKVERLSCDSCQEGSQRWGDGEKKLCGSCYRFAEGKRAAKR